jgi:hypothetical protein
LHHVHVTNRHNLEEILAQIHRTWLDLEEADEWSWNGFISATLLKVQRRDR